jgi:IS30 family transposase
LDRGTKSDNQAEEVSRYEADYTNLIWHTDLHQFHQGEWVIAWIDDRSRMCLGFQFLPNKSSTEIAKELWEILGKYSVPDSIWTDNGAEFEGSFQTIFFRIMTFALRRNPVDRLV